MAQDSALGPIRAASLRFGTLALILGGLLLVGCVATNTPRSPPQLAGQRLDSTLLNSERIALQFGSYGVEVLESGARTRVSSLYSVDGDRRVCRTLAVVVFAADLDPRLAVEHEEILAGGSIGAVLKEAGWTVGKRPRLLGELAPPATSARLFALMDLAASAPSAPLAIVVYEMVLTRSGVAIDYATIAEVYHPGYLELVDLHGLYGRDVPGSVASDHELAAVLDLVEQVVRAPLP